MSHGHETTQPVGTTGEDKSPKEDQKKVPARKKRRHFWRTVGIVLLILILIGGVGRAVSAGGQVFEINPHAGKVDVLRRKSPAGASWRIRASDARADADLNRYEQTVLLALEETENALMLVGRTRERRDALIEAVAASERAAQLADARYQAGAVDFLASLDAQRQVLSFQLQLSESRTRTVTSLIALYKALGGGWEYAPEKRPSR